MRKAALVGCALVLACVTPPPALSTFPPRAGAVWSEDCCGEPVVQKAPEFPAGVPRSEEGWVVVSGILDERGWVTEPVVLTSEPEGVFDAAALKAFDGWRYELPKGGRAIRHEVRAVIPFHVERPRGAASPPMGGSMGGGGGGQPGY